MWGGLGIRVGVAGHGLGVIGSSLPPKIKHPGGHYDMPSAQFVTLRYRVRHTCSTVYKPWHNPCCITWSFPKKFKNTFKVTREFPTSFQALTQNYGRNIWRPFYSRRYPKFRRSLIMRLLIPLYFQETLNPKTYKTYKPYKLLNPINPINS